MKQPLFSPRYGYLILILVVVSTFAVLWVSSAYAAPAQQSPLPDSVLSIPLPAGTDAFEMTMAWDGETLVVGAPWTHNGGTFREGIVYIYSLQESLLEAGDPNPWSLDATITLPTPQAGALLGSAVAVEGDLIVAGASRWDGSVYDDSGLVLFIERTEENPTWHITWIEKNEPRQVPDMNQLDMGEDAYFGASVAILNQKVLIGAPNSDLIWEYQELPAERHLMQGGAWLFERNPPEHLRKWDVTKTFRQDPVDPYTGFGASVAMSRVESLGLTYYAIGAPGTNSMPYTYQGHIDTWWVSDTSPAVWNWHSVPRPLDWEDETGRFGERIALDESFLAVSDARVMVDDAVYVENLLVHLDRLFLYSPNPGTWYDFGSAFAMQGGVLVVGERGTPRYEFDTWGTIHSVERIGDEWELTASLSPDGVAGSGIDENGDPIAGAEGGWFGQAVVTRGNWVLAAAGFAGENGILYILDRRPPPPAPEETPLPWLIPDNIEPLTDPSAAANGESFGNALLPEGVSAQVFAPIILQSSGGTSGLTPTPQPTQPAPTSTPVTPSPTATTPGTTPTASPTASPTATPAPGTGKTQSLTNGGTIRSALGAGVTVAQGAVEGSRTGYVLAVSQPITPLVPYMQALGSFYTVGVVTETLHSSVETYFIVRLPVPAGANVTKLGALVYLPSGSDLLNGDDSNWVYAPGYYDSSKREFSFALTLLPRGGALVVLVTGDTLHTLGASAASAQGANTSNTAAPSAISADPRFDVWCIGVASDDPMCAAELSETAEAFLQLTFSRFKGLGFLPPRLQFASPQLDDNGNPMPFDNLHYAATFLLKGPCAYAGQYNPATMTIDICLESPFFPAGRVETINHEFFHSVQFAYPNLYTDHQWGKNVGFVIEGTASVASRSTDTEMLHDLDWSQRDVDLPLNEPFTDDGSLITYETQDFWVFTGRALGQTMGYLHGLFNLGGEAEDVDLALGNNLEGAYWEWIKNQLLEKQIDPDQRFFFGPCELEGGLTVPSTYYVAEGADYSKSVTLTALTTKTFRIRVDGDLINPLQILVQRAGPETRYKVYKEDGGQGCLSVADNEGMYDGEAVDGDTYIVVVSNANVTDSEFFKLKLIAKGDE